MALSGGTNPTFTLLPTALGNGHHTISAVADSTSLVRNDPTNLLAQTVTWAVNVNLTQLAWILRGG